MNKLPFPVAAISNDLLDLDPGERVLGPQQFVRNLADGIPGRVSVEFLGPFVPGLDGPFQPPDDDGIVGKLDEAALADQNVFGLLAISDVDDGAGHEGFVEAFDGDGTLVVNPKNRTVWPNESELFLVGLSLLNGLLDGVLNLGAVVRVDPGDRPGPLLGGFGSLQTEHLVEASVPCVEAGAEVDSPDADLASGERGLEPMFALSDTTFGLEAFDRVGQDVGD